MAFGRHKKVLKHQRDGLIKSRVKTKQQQKKGHYVVLQKTKKHNLLFLAVLFMEVPSDQQVEF